jgi:MFS family permease
MTTPENRKLSVGSLAHTRQGLAMAIFWILLGAFAWALKGRTGQPTVQILLSDFGESDDSSGILVGAFPGFLTLLFLPILGYLSDSFRSRWGRRIPFLAITIPFVAVSMLGIAVSPSLGTYLGQTLDWHLPGDNNVVFLLSLSWGLFAFADITGNLIFSALINDVVPEFMLGRVFGGIRAFALLAGVLFNYYLFQRVEAGFASIMLGVGLFVVVAITLLCINVREGVYPARPPRVKGWSDLTHEAQNYFSECFGTRFYLLLFIAWGLSTTAWSSVNYYSIFFASSLTTPGHYIELLTITYLISFLMAYPIGVLADRFHPLRLGIVTLALYGLATLWGAIFATTPLNFDIAFVLHGVFSGAFLTSTASLLLRLLPRLKFATYASAAGVMVCFFNIIIAPLAGFVLNMAHRDYRYIFFLSSIQSWLALIVMVVVYRLFLAWGRPVIQSESQSVS